MWSSFQVFDQSSLLQIENHMSLWCDSVQKSIGLFPQTVHALRVLVQEPLKQSLFPRAMQQDKGPGQEMLVAVAEQDRSWPCLMWVCLNHLARVMKLHPLDPFLGPILPSAGAIWSVYEPSCEWMWLGVKPFPNPPAMHLGSCGTLWTCASDLHFQR